MSEEVVVDAAAVAAAEASKAATLALAFLFVGSACAIAGVFILFGLGWALLAGSVPLFVCASWIIRGLRNG
jgi:hypothetical protein